MLSEPHRLPAKLITTMVTCCISMIAGTNALAQVSPPLPAQTEFVRPAPPGYLVDVGGRRLHVLCKGAGSGPTVVFEAGLSQYPANSVYGPAQDAIAPFARVCTYDRAGLGWSDPAPDSWTHQGMLADLHLLITTEFSSPVILVGHSLGGLLARDYAQSHPENVAGLVLLDATSDAGIEELVFAYEATVPRLDEAIAASRPGTPVVTMPVGTSDEVIMAFTPEILRGVRTEFEALDRRISEGSLLSQGGSLGNLPVVVIRRGRMSNPPTQADLDHSSGQETLLALSSNSILITAESSGHAISLDEPLVVADAVRKVIEAFDSDGRLGAK